MPGAVEKVSAKKAKKSSEKIIEPKVQPVEIKFPDDVDPQKVIGFYPHERPLVRGTFLKRRDRFLADVKLDENGEEVESHCVNPGRMEGYVDPGSKVWLLPAEEGSDRKCKYTWELLEHKGLLCGTQTTRPNYIMKQLLENRQIAGLKDWVEMRAEKMLPDFIQESHGKSRIDFWMRHKNGQEHFIEIKNCHMVYEDGFGYFPDSVSERAAKHMGALQALKEAGYRTTSLFLVVRGDCQHGARPSDFHDPWFAKAVRKAAEAGVEFRAFRADCRVDGYLVDKEMRVDVSEYDTTDVARQWEENRAKTGWIRTFEPNANTHVANGVFTHNKPGFWERRAKMEEKAKTKKPKVLKKEKVPKKNEKSAKKILKGKKLVAAKSKKQKPAAKKKTQPKLKKSSAKKISKKLPIKKAAKTVRGKAKAKTKAKGRKK